MKRSPIRRGKGFRSRDREPAELPSIPRELPETGNPVSPPRRGTYGPATLKADPKTVEHRNPDLLGLARGRRCLLTAVDRCRTLDGSTTVACHQNEGKGMARKADDEYSVWGCMFCHEWYDRGSAPRAEKRRAFDAAHERQRIEWARLAYDMSETPKARRAAEWALLQLQPKESNP